MGLNGSRWLDLDGLVNARDLGTLPTRDGGRVLPRRLLRSDNLQSLTPGDVRRLRDDIGLRDVVDLRTDAERELEGPTPLDDDPRVAIHPLSLLPQEGDRVRDVDGDRLLPWQLAPGEVPAARQQSDSVYVAYLNDRPDSIVAALRVVAGSEGATLLHCAVGKDRTGVVVALALDLVGVDREAIVEDYLLTGERIDALIDRLQDSPTYALSIRGRPRESHLPNADAVTAVFNAVDAYDGTAGWLAAHGWTATDTAALATRLTG